MSETKEKKPSRRPETGDSQIIGFRMPKPVAKAIKVEAARRQIPLNGLLAEMWQLYRENKRAG
jgi:predicted HicB family RNase H-like nuclease